MLIDVLKFFYDVFNTVGFVCSFLNVTLILLTWKYGEPLIIPANGRWDLI
jgi:hypothetical protein